ncbi:alpha/beta hydrolase [Aquibium sp. ELW1220]|uniref:alpha/beta hydrolase n=1 Tax=Aquibium sp. ELW1220 TaxID=2976766 RepID=UPI0025B07E7E|nr:alpha/beta hydrolase [Aquibium sp. ELW1220]MDN2581782.1 alpha/beta hydrolase [Aquibium sp. ELW1220]
MFFVSTRLAEKGLRCVAAAFLAVASAWPLPAHASDPMLGVTLSERLADGDRDGAIALLSAALVQETEPRARSDLLEQKARIETEAGRPAQAAATRLALADLIAAEDGENAPDLILVLDAVAGDLIAAGRPGEAVDALDRALAIVRSAGLAETAQPLLDRLAAIDDPDAAERARSVADLHAQETDRLAETGRSFDVDPDTSYSTVRIYYATDRARTEETLPAKVYGGDRGELELGTATVSIPEVHKPGRIEKPSIWTFDFREDPERHIVLLSVTPKTDEDVFVEMRAQVAETGKAEAFVFVHGFNVPFHEAAQRTAQMAYDMNFDGLPILYSWPSRSSLLAYIADTAVVNLSGRRLSRFLEDVVAKSGAQRIHLIAHSMGNRALTDALELFALRYRGSQPAFDQVLFTAPDLDAGLFSEMMKTIRVTARRITLYASNKDWALAVSRRLHGDSPRAGQGGRNILHVADVDSIDMTEIGEDMLKHSYYANNPSALTDILSLFWRDAPPDKRCGMKRAQGEQGSYWQYLPAECDGDALLSTLSLLRLGSINSANDARLFMNRFIMPVTIDKEERGRLEAALKKLFGGD